MARKPVLSSVLRTLRTCYGGNLPILISQDPFELILWEQVGYLVPDRQRRKAFLALKSQIGVRPTDILSASSTALTGVARQGGPIAASSRAGRMRHTAELVLERWNGDLRRVFNLPLAQARRALASFPMIGPPGADKILSFLTPARILALDSNGLRVVQRLGLAPVRRDYRGSYNAAQAVLAPVAPRARRQRVAAYYLLREHGQTLCRRSAPNCPGCPLRPSCPTGQLGDRGT